VQQDGSGTSVTLFSPVSVFSRCGKLGCITQVQQAELEVFLNIHIDRQRDGQKMNFTTL